MFLITKILQGNVEFKKITIHITLKLAVDTVYSDISSLVFTVYDIDKKFYKELNFEELLEIRGSIYNVILESENQMRCISMSIKDYNLMRFLDFECCVPVARHKADLITRQDFIKIKNIYSNMCISCHKTMSSNIICSSVPEVIVYCYKNMDIVKMASGADIYFPIGIKDDVLKVYAVNICNEIVQYYKYRINDVDAFNIELSKQVLFSS